MTDAALDAKREKIRKMLEMQRRFIALDRGQGVEMQDYFAPGDGDPLAGYRDEYNELAMAVIDEAHAQKGSRR